MRRPATLSAIRLATILVIAIQVTGAPAQEGLAIPADGYVVSDDLELLPAPVREKHEKLLAAAKSGEMSRLKAIFEGEAAPPTVSFGEPADPIAYLEHQSGDGDGLEMLAILADLLAAPYAAMDGGDGEPVYVWPYLAAFEDLGRLTPAERIDGYRIMGYSAFRDMQDLGTWYYWRVYMSARGDLEAFIAGD
ncbi:MAG: hypothetical protein Q8L54_10885 [Devosia sp.]|nr:hypothetical protein [Devosia sp.]